ncbi:hypothetical protein TCON_1056 [Astathelohania contejeani]|uniref:Uncharacterized protein n=1 Tax=Astathelohania contejeani TaxID=164912 RepID=A0ABQ7HZU2_9MICR|nr:hypothetical protein TCON_1056 [Thelohania contejeani]
MSDIIEDIFDNKKTTKEKKNDKLNFKKIKRMRTNKNKKKGNKKKEEKQLNESDKENSSSIDETLKKEIEKRRKNNKKKIIIDDDSSEYGDIRGTKETGRRYTEDGYPIYTMEELKIGQGISDSDHDPFECDCCF